MAVGVDPIFVFMARRVGLRFQVFYRTKDEPDDAARAIGPKFWRSLSAMRLMSAMQMTCNTAQWYGAGKHKEGDERQMLKDHIDALPPYAEVVLIVATPGDSVAVGTNPEIMGPMILSMARRIENRLN